MTGKDVRRRATVKQSVRQGVRQSVSIRLDGLSRVPARKTPHFLCGNPYFGGGGFLLPAACKHQHSSSSRIAAEADIDTQQPVGRNIRPPWMPFWGWGNVLPRSRVSFCPAFFDVIPETNRRRAPSKASARLQALDHHEAGTHTCALPRDHGRWHDQVPETSG